MARGDRMSSDAKIRNAGKDFDAANLKLAREVLANPTHHELRHLVEWAERVTKRLEKSCGN